MTSGDHLKAVKADILKGATERKKQTIEALWDVLSQLRMDGVRTFSVAAVGRACDAAGILKTQSIRNAAGADYRRLIDAFREASHPNDEEAGTKRRRNGTDPLTEIVDGLADLDARTRLKMLMADHGRQREEITRLREGFKRMVSASPHTTESASSSGVPASVLTPLKRFLSTDWLEEHGLQRDPNGAIYDRKGDRITPIGFAKALEQVFSASAKTKP